MRFRGFNRIYAVTRRRLWHVCPRCSQGFGNHEIDRGTRTVLRRKYQGKGKTLCRDCYTEILAMAALEQKIEYAPFLIRNGSSSSRKQKWRGRHARHQKYICPYCKRRMMENVCQAHPLRVTLDHIVAQALGGKNTFKNTHAVCYECNNKKSVSEGYIARGENAK